MSARADNTGSRGHPRHVIDTAIFELSFGSGPVDWSDEGELARVVERELMSVVNDVFDESAPAAGTVRIDNLEVDLGPLVFDGSWIRVRERLREQLRTAIAHAQTDPAGGQGGPLQALRADLSTAAGFDLLVHFLRFGVLPEQARIQDVKGMEAELQEVARAAPQSVAALIRDPALGDVVAARLVRQFPDSLLRQLAEALSPVDAALMVGLVQRLQQLIGRAGSTVVWKDEIHQVLWVRLLKDLAALNPPPITVTARHAIEGAARAAGRSYGELVDQLGAQDANLEELAALLGRLASDADARPRPLTDGAVIKTRSTRSFGAKTPGSRGAPDRTLQSPGPDDISSAAGFDHLLDTLEHGHQKALGRLLQQLRSGEVSLSNLTGKLSTTGHRHLLAGVLKALAQGTGGGAREFQKAVDAHAPRAHSERTFYRQVIERLVADELIDLEAIALGGVRSSQVQEAPHEAQVQTDAQGLGAQRAGAESDEMDKPLQKQLLEEAARSDAGIEKQKGVASGDLSLQGQDLSHEAQGQAGMRDPGVSRPGARRAGAENGAMGKPLHSQLSEEAVHSGAEVEKQKAIVSGDLSLQGPDLSREAREQAGVPDPGVPRPGARRAGAENGAMGKPLHSQLSEEAVHSGAEVEKQKAIVSGDLSLQGPDLSREAREQAGVPDPGVPRPGARRAEAESDGVGQPLHSQLSEEAAHSGAVVEKREAVEISLQGQDISREAKEQAGVRDLGVPQPGTRRVGAESAEVGKPLQDPLAEKASRSGAEVEKREAIISGDLSSQGRDLSREAKEQAGVPDPGVPQPGTRRVGAESDEVGTPLQDPLAEKASRSGAEVEKREAIVSGDLSSQGRDLSREAQEQAGVQDPGVQGSVTQRTGVDSVEAEHYLRDYLCNGVVPSNGGNAYLRRAAEHLYALAPQQFAGLVRRSATDEAAVTRLTGLLPESLLTQVLSLLAPAVHDRMLRYADTIVDACHTPELDISAEQFKRLKWQSCFQYLLAGRPHWDPASFLRQFSEQIAAHSQRLESAQLYALMRRRLALTGRTAEGDEPGFESAQVPGLRTGMDQAMTPGTGVETAGATHVTQNREVLEQGIRITNAGLVLAAPWLPRLFGMLELVEEGAFRHPAARQRAVHLLQYLVDERCDTPEYGLVLNKVLCGLDTAMPLSREIVPVEREKEAIEGLLRGMIQHWKVLKGTSVSGLRETFLQRKGTLRLQDDGWHLAVEPEAFDILIDQIPWSFSMIKHSWMEEVVYVDWR